ncbi:hypothetical protein Poli38472_007610 [Pythium oligandrum]|uniref:Glutathione transferase n=1 Tax=Pythium oligandrum TaxID=41045 RepID=A0A8K1CS36_PYTOL|nr:hypothetical protein Poli38472_007610 [Pythium oligandrum]|eukprot:TMW67938.1 hypothetical protein Poli38472_007610 [Pythium oligandrum]
MATVGVSRMRYFNLRSRAELVRLVYAYGRLPLEEEAVPLGREYLSIKPTLLFGQLPEMDIDGKRYAQSIALARYAAKHVGLYPLDDHRKALEVDMIVDTARDILAPIASNVFLERDAERRTKAINKLNKYELPGFLGGMESQLSSGAKDSEPFFLGTQVSLADLAVFDVIDNMLVPEKDIFPIDFEAQYPGLVNVVEHVKKIPAIEEYLATRPDRSNKPIF